MHSDEAVDRLRTLVREAGVDPEHLTHEDIERTWSAMRVFAAERADDVGGDEDDDGILAQYGVYDWSYTGASEFFELDMTRQFSFYEDGEYDHMAQLNCTFRFTPTDELRALGEQTLWSFGLPLDTFFEQALGMPGFAGVRASGAVPVELDIDYGDV